MPPLEQLQTQLRSIISRERRLRLWCKLAACWTAAAVLGFVMIFIERETGWSSFVALPLIALLAVSGVLWVILRHSKQTPDWRNTARRVEALYPQLDGRLLTAIQQSPTSAGELNYLQERLVEEALTHSQKADWSCALPRSRVVFGHAAHWLALLLFAFTLLALRTTSGNALLARRFSTEVTVTPGDANIEHGSTLVVLARFGRWLPPSVHLVISQSAVRVPLVKSLGDPMFGGSLAEVTSNFVYYIEYSGQRTRDFKVTVFEHPRLERADAALTYPEYTGLPAKRIEDTKRVSAVEGSHLDLSLKLNKPVASARLVSKDKAAQVVSLTIQSNQPSASLSQFLLFSNQTFELQLVDTEGRTNKIPTQFVFEALKNRTPEIRLSSPRGDQRPSPIEELSFEGTVWDDFGMPAFGLGYMIAGHEPHFIELGQGVPAQEKRSFHHLLHLEELGLLPDQVISWFVWADDIGPDGKVRRTTGDLFFGEVRPFEEVFREASGMEGQSQGREQGGENQTAKLTDLQKQIISATWKLQRGVTPSRGTKRSSDSSSILQKSDDQIRTARKSAELLPMDALAPDEFEIATTNELFSRIPRISRFERSSSFVHPSAFGRPVFFGQVIPNSSRNGQKPDSTTSTSRSAPLPDDLTVIRESQAQALQEAEAAYERQRDPRAAALWRAAIKDMDDAVGRLKTATNSPAEMKEAIAAEQAAYQALLRLQEHEYQVARSRNRNQGASSRDQQLQRQLEQMDLTQSENRYETQRDAQRPQTARREQLQIMNRLQELARRQQDLNERLKELQTALQEARTEEERAEIRRRLKRLQEEEQQMLADVDELRQRMDRPENQSQMAEQRRELDQTREDVQRAAEAAGQAAPSQALASGTRAQRKFQELHDQMRKESSSQFADDLREMRGEARELARQQEDILKKLQNESGTETKSLSDSPERKQALDELARQNQLTTNLLARANQVSQQAEAPEPLLANQLYDTVRKFTQQSAKDVKETTDDLLNRGLMTRSLFDRLKENSTQDASKLHDITSEMLKLGFLPQATQTGERARAGIEELKNGVERAAESVLGDDTEALRLAQQELDQLAGQLQREIAQGKAEAGQTNSARSIGQAEPNQRNTNQVPGSAQASQQQQLAQSGNQSTPGAEQATQDDSQSPAQPGNASSSATQKAPSANQGRPASAQASAQPAESQDGQSPSSSRGKQNAQAQNAQGQNAQTGENGTTPGPRNPGGARRRSSLEAADTPGGGGAGATRDLNWERLLHEDTWRQTGPITGDDFVSWADRLREVEEMLDQPDLRNDVAAARERARAIRQDFNKERKKPDWAVVQLQVMKPLTEVRDRVADELARRQSRDALVPIDRDPVPNRYSDLVRRYYEELGKDK